MSRLVKIDDVIDYLNAIKKHGEGFKKVFYG